jgi:septal ring factor EnvC (AmiA/AmiB activator)
MTEETEEIEVLKRRIEWIRRGLIRLKVDLTYLSSNIEDIANRLEELENERRREK